MLLLALEGRMTVVRTRRTFPFEEQAPGSLRYLQKERGLCDSAVNMELVVGGWWNGTEVSSPEPSSIPR
jgi:hypothetical protein